MFWVAGFLVKNKWFHKKAKFKKKKLKNLSQS